MFPVKRWSSRRRLNREIKRHTESKLQPGSFVWCRRFAFLFLCRSKNWFWDSDWPVKDFVIDEDVDLWGFLRLEEEVYFEEDEVRDVMVDREDSEEDSSDGDEGEEEDTGDEDR